jgi:hypothetical protein
VQTGFSTNTKLFKPQWVSFSRLVPSSLAVQGESYGKLLSRHSTSSAAAKLFTDAALFRKSWTIAVASAMQRGAKSPAAQQIQEEKNMKNTIHHP